MYLFKLSEPNYGYRFNLNRFSFNFWACLAILFFFILLPVNYCTHIEKGTQDYYVYGQRVYFNGSLEYKERELITSKYDIPLNEKKHVFYYGVIPYTPGEGININALPPKYSKVNTIQSTDEKIENTMRNTHHTIIGVTFCGFVLCLGAMLFLLIIFSR